MGALNLMHGIASHIIAPFLPQAVDQLVQCLTDDKYKNNMVVIVAGYAADIEDLMEANPGLASRFPETLHFKTFSVDDCCALLMSALKSQFSTHLSPEVKDTLRETLAPLVQVRPEWLESLICERLVFVSSIPMHHL